MTVLAYLGGVWVFCALLIGAASLCGWMRARVENRAGVDTDRRDRGWKLTVYDERTPPTDTHPTTGPLLRRLADEGAEILARERQR